MYQANQWPKKGKNHKNGVFNKSEKVKHNNLAINFDTDKKTYHKQQLRRHTPFKGNKILKDFFIFFPYPQNFFVYNLQIMFILLKE